MKVIIGDGDSLVTDLLVWIVDMSDGFMELG